MYRTTALSTVPWRTLAAGLALACAGSAAAQTATRHIAFDAPRSDPESLPRATLVTPVAPTLGDRVVAPPAPGVALGALRQELANLAVPSTSTRPSAYQPRIAAALSAVSAVLADLRNVGLPEAQLCVSTELPATLAAMQREGTSTAAARSALDAVCALPSDSWSQARAADATGGIGMADSGTVTWDPRLRIECGDLGVRPPDMPGATTYYAFAGYELSLQNSRATLEEGDLLVGKGRCKSSVTFDGLKIDYGVKVDLNYVGNDDFIPHSVTLASYLGDGETVALPSDVRFRYSAVETGGTLTYQSVQRTCTTNANPTCWFQALGTPRKQEFELVPLGDMCSLDYAYTEFTINDRKADSTEFQIDWISGMTLDGTFADWDPVFNAFARGVFLTGAGLDTKVNSTFPEFSAIQGNAMFAVHRTDQLSLFDEWLPANLRKLKRADYIAASGVGPGQLSALRFPRVVTHNFVQGGAPFSYTCKPPRIVRDYVAFCSAASPAINANPPGSAAVRATRDSTTLLPYRTKTWVEMMNQQWSHTGDEAYAWDFDTETSSDARIFASRSGTVYRATDEFDGNGGPGSPCDKNPDGKCHNNEIYVVHQDGTVGEYLHLRQGSLLAHVGDTVKRGQVLADSGSVGNALNRHIHFQVNAGRSDLDAYPPEPNHFYSYQSIPAAFDDQDNPCVTPHFLDTPESTLTIGQDSTLKYKSKPNLNLPPKR